MTYKIIKLDSILTKAGFGVNKRSVLLVYLSIVLLGKKIPEAAKFFNLPEIDVQTALTVCGVKLNKDIEFVNKMKFVTGRFADQLRLNQKSKF
jgi:hypothetical protein